MNNNFENDIKEYFNKVSEVLSKLDVGIISEVANLLIKTLNDEGTIYIFGNGGSASTASHFQNDFNRTLSDYSQKKFKVNCLSDNIPTLTAIANDFSECVKDISGEYFYKYKIAKSSARSKDMELAKKLYEFSWELITSVTTPEK